MQVHRRTSRFVVSLCVLAGACAAPSAVPQVPPERIMRDNEEGFRRSALERAAFELRCERDAIHVRALNAAPGPGAQIGAECEGRRIVYVFRQVGPFEAAWVAESVSSDAPPAP